MFKDLKKALITLIIFSLILTPAVSFAATEEMNAISVTADILVFRPAGIALVPVTVALFVVAYPFSLIGNKTDKVYEALIAENLRYTFQRPLGEDVPIK